MSALQRYRVWTDHYVTDADGEWVVADDAEAELKAKDERIAELEQNAACDKTTIARLMDERDEWEDSQIACGARVAQLETEKEQQGYRLNDAQGLLIEAEGMLCDPQGGPAANQCAERIREFLVPAARVVEGQLPEVDCANCRRSNCRFPECS